MKKGHKLEDFAIGAAKQAVAATNKVAKKMARKPAKKKAAKKKGERKA